MQSNITYLIGIAAGMGMFLSTAVALAQTERSAQAGAVAQAVCPTGYHWENATYVHGGKWRDAHCARDTAVR